jgi:cell division protein FtsB
LKGLLTFRVRDFVDWTFAKSLLSFQKIAGGEDPNTLPPFFTADMSKKGVISVFRNFYFLASIAFVVWLLIADRNDLFSQIKLRSKVTALEKEKEYYLEKIEEIKAERDAVLNNPAQLEKIARERYYMKKPGEDIFVLEYQK